MLVGGCNNSHLRKRLRVLRSVHTVRLRLCFISHNQWTAWDLVLLSQLYHVNNYIESHATNLL